MRYARFMAPVALAYALAACAKTVPDPKRAAQAYADAAAHGDANAIYAMLTSRAQEDRSKDDVRALVANERDELGEQARAFAGPDLRVEATARLRFADGEESALDFKAGEFRVTSAGALPGGARTTEQALDELRRVLARRSYAGLMRILSPSTRAAIELDLRSFVTALERPDTLPIQVTGDVANVSIPSGHHVRLKREGGIWRIEDFD